MGLSCDTFYSLTIKQWEAIQKGWKAKRDYEIHEKAVLTVNIMTSSGNIKKGTSFKSLYDSIVKQLKGEESEKEQIISKCETECNQEIVNQIKIILDIK